MLKEMQSLHKNDIWELSFPKGGKSLATNGYWQRKNDLDMHLFTTKSCW